MRQVFFHTAMTQEAINALQSKGFKIAPPAIYEGGNGSFYLVLNVKDQRYWITNDVGLKDQNEIAEARYEQNILPISMEEIMNWNTFKISA